MRPNTFNLCQAITTLIIIFLFSVPETVFSQEDLKIIYTSPVASSKWNKCETNIILKANQPFSVDELKSLKLLVSGSDNRRIEGELIQTTQSNTLVFKPFIPFRLNERVEVSLTLVRKQLKGSISLCEFYFNTELETTINKQSVLKQEFEFVEQYKSSNSWKIPANKDERKLNDLPESFPEIEITVNNNPQTGFYFLNAFFAGGTDDPAYIMIFDSTGFPVFYKKFVQQISAFFLQEETGTLTYYDADFLHFIELDSSYNQLNHYLAKNGYITDGHELILKSNGNYWIIALDHQIVDMSQLVPGGDTAAIVEGMVLQEIDASGNVVFQWRSWDHYEITDADPNIVNLTAHRIDYVHTNAIHFDWDGNILISNRNMSEITKIDYATGNIIWRWGGLNNEFFISGANPIFLAQHDIRYIGDSLYTLFDNGIMNYRPYSRGLVFSLNQVDKTGALAYDFRDPDSVIFSRFMGSMRYQENENYMVGWSGNPMRYVVTEYQPDGQKVFEMESVDAVGLVSYRALKYDWETSLFNIAEDSLNFGNDVPIGDSVSHEITVINNDVDEIEINGFHTIHNVFSLETVLPMVIPGGESQVFIVKFKPTVDITYKDVLSLIYDTDDSRVASQVSLIGGGLITSISQSEDLISNLQIWPNPASDFINIRYELALDGQVQIELNDIRGQQIKTLVNDNQIKGIQQLNLNSSNLAKGVYLIKLSITTRNNQYIELGKFVRK